MAAGHRLLPREHGTWAMLVTPWMIGCGVAGRMSGEAVLLLVALIGWFLAQSQLMTWWRLRRAGRCAPSGARTIGTLVTIAAVALVASLPLVLGPRGRGLVLLGMAAAIASAVALLFIDLRVEHGVPGQVLAAVGLTLSGPAAWYVATGRMDAVALGLWLLNASYFVAAVWYVRMLIAARARRAPIQSVRARLAFAAPTLLVEAALVVIAAAALRVGQLGVAALWGFAPLMIQVVLDTVRLDRPPPLKRVGLVTAVSSALFAVLVIGLA